MPIRRGTKSRIHELQCHHLILLDLTDTLWRFLL